MDNSKNKSDECLNTLHVVGTAILFAPIIIALPAILYAAISGKGIGIDVGEAGFASGLMITAGFLIIGYVSIKKFKEAYCKTMGNTEV